jgi:hypothetical protein
MLLLLLLLLLPPVAGFLMALSIHLVTVYMHYES